MTAPGEDDRWRFACVARRDGAAASLAVVLASLWPDAVVETIDLANVRGIPDADLALFDGTSSPRDAVQTMVEARARGTAGELALVVSDDVVPEENVLDQLGRIGAATVRLGAMHTELPLLLQRIAHARAAAHGDVAVQRAQRALARTRRLLAAGDVALGLQHALNNPLAALLAEAQLLELEELPADHRQSVQRIIELCRRVIDVVRTLEGVGRTE